MEKKPIRTILLVVVVLSLVLCAFGGGFIAGKVVPMFDTGSAAAPDTQDTSPTAELQGGTPADLQTVFGSFWEAWDLLHTYYVDQPLDDVVLVQGAIRGMLEAVGDPYTGYWTPVETNDAMMSMQGEYDGIGAWVDTTTEYLTITQPMPGYPAEQAGLLAGDQIIAVDGEDVTGVDPELVRLTKVLGPAGSTVRLTILRDSENEPLEFEIVRAHIVVASVESEMLDDNIAYIKIIQFGDNTGRDFKAQLEQLMAQAPAGIVLDLRNNGGGYLDEAIIVASQFISQGPILYEEYSDGSRTSEDALPGGLALDIPVVVLVNEYTASASEIVAGAIQDYERGQLIGVTTFGKGVVQNYFPLQDGGTARVTISKWLTPNGNTIHEQGLTPDVVVELTEADAQAERDPQLDAAIQLLLGR
jgi:carboxyl-terminal processing protease